MNPANRPQSNRRYWLAPAVAFLILGLTRLLNQSIPETLEMRWLDGVLRFRASDSIDARRMGWGFARPLDERIRFVEINMSDRLAELLADEGEFGVAAHALESIASLGPKVIALDILYGFGRTSDQDLLANTIRNLNSESSSKIVVPAEWRSRDRELLYSLPSSGGAELPFGLVNVDIDDDRMWRHYRLTRVCSGKTYPSLAMAAFLATQPDGIEATTSEKRLGVLEWKTLDDSGLVVNRSVDDQAFLLNFQHSYYDASYDQTARLGKRVWNLKEIEAVGKAAPELSPFQDAIVFLGFGSDFDAKPMVHGPMEPGMVLHATALHDLIHQTALHRLSLGQDFLVLIVTSLLAIGCFAWIKKKLTLLITGLAGLILIGVASCCFVWFGNRVPATIATGGFWIIAYIGEIARRWANEQRDRIQRDAMLGFSFSPAVLKQVMNNRDMIQPRGGNMAVLLSDLRGFTSICETMQPEQVFELLNRLFGIETEVALRQNGSLRPFAGDQFIAYWGAPELCVDSADRALSVAMEICRTLALRQKAPNADTIDNLLQIGIGLHYGAGLVGHVGCRQYRDYNILGDLVNVAARVESQSKNYHAPILATQEFIDALSSPIECVCLDHVRVSGRKSPLRLFGVPAELGPSWPKEKADYQNAFSVYSKGDFGTAKTLFEKLSRGAHGMIMISGEFLGARCGALLEKPPVDWEGIYDFRSK